MWVYKAPTGVRIGTPEAPQLINDRVPVLRDDKGKIDWSDPNILSPKPKLRTFTDYSLLDATIMDAAEFAGLTWNLDEIEIDAGDTQEFIKEYIERAKTPFLPQKLALQDAGVIIENEETEETEDDEEEG